MPRKSRLPAKKDEADPEQLHALDENNKKWVDGWKRAVKPKAKTSSS